MNRRNDLWEECLRQFNELWIDIKKMLGDLPKFVEDLHVPELSQPTFTLRGLLHSYWLSGFALLVALYFYMRKQPEVAAVILVGVAALYIFHELVPMMIGQLSGVVVFSVAVFITAMVGIYLAFIHDD